MIPPAPARVTIHDRDVRKRRLAECVAALAIAIADGKVVPELVELQALAYLCDEHGLPTEAMRVRWWIARDFLRLRRVH